MLQRVDHDDRLVADAHLDERALVEFLQRQQASGRAEAHDDSKAVESARVVEEEALALGRTALRVVDDRPLRVVVPPAGPVAHD